MSRFGKPTEQQSITSSSESTSVEENFYFEETERERQLRLKKEARKKFLKQKQKDRNQKLNKRREFLEKYRSSKILREHNKSIFKKRREWEILNHLITKFGLRKKQTRCVPESVLRFSWLDLTEETKEPTSTKTESNSDKTESKMKITNLYLGLPDKYQTFYYVVANDKNKKIFRLEMDDENFKHSRNIKNAKSEKFKFNGIKIEPNKKFWNADNVDLQLKLLVGGDKDVDVQWYYCCTDEKCKMPTKQNPN